MAIPQPIYEQLKEAYAQNDKDENGHLTRDELIPILTGVLGYNATPYVNEVILIADKDGSGTINSIEELDLALKKTGLVRLTTIFRKYDKDGKFGLSKEELIPMLEEILGYTSASYADEVMQAGDLNGSGTIDTMYELQEALYKTNKIKEYFLLNEFGYYDDKACTDGFITQEDIVKITEDMPADRKEELVTTFKKADVSGDGKVSMQEYVQHMMKQ